MKNMRITEKMNDVLTSAKNAQAQISKLNQKEKASLEKEWDVEHAYYSSTLEGSNIDRKEFEKMAKKVA